MRWRQLSEWNSAKRLRTAEAGPASPATPRERQDLSSSLAAHNIQSANKQIQSWKQFYQPSQRNSDTVRETAGDAKLRLALLVLLGACGCAVTGQNGGRSRCSSGRRASRQRLEAKTTGVRAAQNSNRFCNICKIKTVKIACQEAGRLTAVAEPAHGISDCESNRSTGGKVCEPCR